MKIILLVIWLTAGGEKITLKVEGFKSIEQCKYVAAHLRSQVKDVLNAMCEGGL